ncbi:MAG: type II secretion system protein [Chthoniobacter sp.]|nr:type II secretion system protein [Chthoniobacter sp.]
MHSKTSPSVRHPAFTLVELLTVIAIIAILMALLFPLFIIIMDRVRKAEATAACTDTVTAVRAFHTDYGKYPSALATAPATLADVIVGDTVGGAAAGNENLFNTLRAISTGTNTGHVLNPRKVTYIEGRNAKSSTAPKSGFASSGAYYDPWGAQYCVALDADADNQLTTLPYADFNGAIKGPRFGIGAYSLGKDGKLGKDGSFKDSDDIITWQ